MADHTHSLAGRTALVTGAAHRIGNAIARGLHGAGADVVLHYRRSREAAEALAGELEGARAGSAVTVGGDLRDPANLPRLVQAALEAFGRLDVLVNNASTFYPTPLDNIDEAAWGDLIDTNLKAPLFLAQAAAAHLRRHEGVIVNLADIHAERPLAGHALYCISKAGVVMLTKALAAELGPRVRVNAVAPGAILWPENGMDEPAREAIVARTALKRRGDPADIAAAVLYLVRDAPYVTGEVLVVDGGRSLVS